MIAVHGLRKSYRAPGLFGGAAIDVLRGVDLEAAPRKVLGIMGPNGAGKTTLLEILATTVLPDAGSAAIAGHDVVLEADEVRRLVSYCPASGQAFYPRLTGTQNLTFFAALHGVVGRPALERVREALDSVGLDGAGAAAVQTYSDGMRQRLALARALVSGCRVLLLDEPTKSLDPAGRASMHQLLRRLNETERLTIVLVTHSAEEALAVCDRVARLERGVVSDVGPPQPLVRAS